MYVLYISYSTMHALCNKYFKKLQMVLYFKNAYYNVNYSSNYERELTVLLQKYVL